MTFPLYLPDEAVNASRNEDERKRNAKEIWNLRSRRGQANLGLVFDKFFGGWTPDFTGREDTKEKTAKAKWVEQIAQACPLEPLKTELEQATRRQAELVRALGGAVWYAVATSRFVTGTGIANPLENGFAFHHTLGVPCLTASGLKGGLKSYWEQWSGDNAGSGEMLGTAKGVGSIVFFDMLPTAPVTLVPEVMTPHYGEWYQNGASHPPGDWMSPTPIPFIAVEAGAIFQIAAAPRMPPKEKTDGTRDTAKWDGGKLRDILKNALDITGLGAKTAVGYGRFDLRDTREQAGARANEIKYPIGHLLPERTLLTWGDYAVTTTSAVTLMPGVQIFVRSDEADPESADVSWFEELKHIK